MPKNRIYIISIGIFVLLVLGYFAADALLFDGVKAQPINKNGFQANFFVKENTENKTAVVLIGGGQWGDYWAAEIAKQDMAGLSLPYIGKEGLPNLPEEIALEYFEKAISWLSTHKAVDPKKIVVMGASRNAELALLIASQFPELISGAVAYAPSSVAWSNTVLPYNSDEIKASWKYKGVDIPYVPMDKISGNDSDTIKMLDYWETGLSNKAAVQKAMIQVEKINGPILLFSGKDDQVWPAAKMADMIEQRLQRHGFKYSFNNIKYENAGHQISGNPEQLSNTNTGNMVIDGKEYNYKTGGTPQGDVAAKKDANIKLLEFLHRI